MLRADDSFFHCRHPRTPARRWISGISALAISLACCLGASAQSVLIDFGAAGNQTVTDEQGRYWNNLTDGNGGASDTGQLTELLSVDGEITPLGLSMIRRFTGANTNGTQSGTAYTASATADSLYGNTELWNGLTDVFPSFKLTGLNPQSGYRLTMYASRTGVGDNRETGYTVTGVNTGFAALDPANNDEATVVVAGIVPTQTGEIVVTLGPTENNTNGFHFTYLGALLLEVDGAPPPEPVSVFQEPQDVTVLQGRPATFSVQLKGAPPYTVQWRKNNEAIPQATDLSYTVPAATLDLSGATYSVAVTNATGNATSRNAQLTVTPDTQAPTLAGTAIQDASTFLLTFDEPITGPQAGTPAGYTASTQDGPIAVVEAELLDSGRQVRLVLAQPAVGTLTIAFNGLVDLAGNPVAATTTAVIPIPLPPANTLLFDFGSTAEATNTGAAPDDPINIWNNITGVTEGTGVADLVMADGSASGLGFVITSRFGGVNTNGTRDASAPFAARATTDSFFGNTEEFGGLSNLTPKFTLSGLDPSMVYDFTFYASRVGAGGDNRETRYTVTGQNAGSAELNASENVEGTAVVAGIVPVEGENGPEISVELTPSENNTNGNHFVYLGAMSVRFRERGVTPADPVMLSPVLSDGKIILNWTGSGRLERSATLRAGEWSAVLPAPTPPYAEDLVPGESRYYRVVAP